MGHLGTRPATAQAGPHSPAQLLRVPLRLSPLPSPCCPAGPALTGWQVAPSPQQAAGPPQDPEPQPPQPSPIVLLLAAAAAAGLRAAVEAAGAAATAAGPGSHEQQLLLWLWRKPLQVMREWRMRHRQTLTLLLQLWRHPLPTSWHQAGMLGGQRPGVSGWRGRPVKQDKSKKAGRRGR